MTKGLTIFYVDDDSDDLDFFKYVADEIGAHTIVFSLGEDMLQAMSKPPPAPSVVFLDLNMPIKSGFDLLGEIAMSKVFSNIPIVVISTASDSYTVEKSFRLGASKYMVKQRSLHDLKKCLEHVLEIDWLTFERNHQNFLVGSC